MINNLILFCLRWGEIRVLSREKASSDLELSLWVGGHQQDWELEAQGRGWSWTGVGHGQVKKGPGRKDSVGGSGHAIGEGEGERVGAPTPSLKLLSHLLCRPRVCVGGCLPASSPPDPSSHVLYPHRFKSSKLRLRTTERHAQPRTRCSCGVR